MKHFLISTVSIIAGFFIIRTIITGIGQVAVPARELQMLPLVGAFLLFGITFLFLAVSWYWVMRSLSQKLPIAQAIKIWFISQAFRYIPGSVVALASRVVLSERLRIPKTKTSQSLAIEHVLMVATALVLCLPYLVALVAQYWWDLSPRQQVLVAGGLALSLVVLVLGLMRQKFRLFVGRYAAHLEWQSIGMAIIFQVLAWSVFGAATTSVVYGLGASGNPFTIASAGVLAWLIGFVSIVTPLGLGVREMAFVVVTAGVLPASMAMQAAFLARIISMVAELVQSVGWAMRDNRYLVANLYRWLMRRWDLSIVLLLSLIYSYTFSYFSILRHDAFASGYDLANMDQTIWNTVYGTFFSFSGDTSMVSRLTVHADFILILLAPLYLLWNDVRILLIAQSVFLGFGIFPTYLIAYHLLKSRVAALLLAGVYFVNPSMHWTNIYDFHGVALAIPFILAAFYCFLSKRYGWFALFIGLALTTKEQISLIIAILGFLLVIVYRQRTVGLATALAGISWFIVVVYGLMPWARGGNQHWVFAWFSFSDQMAQSQSQEPLVAFIAQKFVFAGDVVGYYIRLLQPYGYLPLVGLPWLALAAPDLLINVLSSHAPMRSTTLHYDSGITPALTLATIYAIRYLKFGLDQLRNLQVYGHYILIAVCAVLLLVAVKVSYLYGPLPINPACWCYIYNVTAEDRAFAKVLQTIPEDASFTGSGEVRVHVSHRKEAYTLPHLTESIDYVGILTQNRLVDDTRIKGYEAELIPKLKIDPNFQLLYESEHFLLFKRLGVSQ